MIRKFCSVKSHKTIQKVMHHQQHADLKSEICKQRNSNHIIPQNPQNLSTMILAPEPSNSNLNSQKQKIRTVRRLYKKCFQHSDSQITASNPLNIQQCNQWEYSMAYIIQRHFQSYPAKITASGRSVGQQAVETVAKMVCALILHTSCPEKKWKQLWIKTKSSNPKNCAVLFSRFRCEKIASFNTTLDHRICNRMWLQTSSTKEIWWLQIAWDIDSETLLLPV